MRMKLAMYFQKRFNEAPVITDPIHIPNDYEEAPHIMEFEIIPEQKEIT